MDRIEMEYQLEQRRKRNSILPFEWDYPDEYKSVYNKLGAGILALVGGIGTFIALMVLKFIFWIFSFIGLGVLISALVGTHTHIGTDDLIVDNGVGYLTDIGLTGCFDNVIGMGKKEAIKRLKNGFSKHLDVEDKCQKIFQAVIFEFDGVRCIDSFKVKGQKT
jgi:hypothetical protein